MRLICPNCDAQYEVDDAVIPKGGRDVQCSNCGHTWFQRPAGEEPEPETGEVPVPQAGAADTGPAAETEPPAAEAEAEHAEAEAEVETKVEFETEVEFEAEVEETGPATPAGELPERKALDEAVLNVLREEAEREQEARREKPGPSLETQPDLGLDSAARGEGLQERVARLRGIAPETEDSGSRKNLLPDIEEINSTLRASGGDRDAVISADEGLVIENAELPRQRGGFGLGFGIVLLLAALVVALYTLAPSIVEMAPALDPVMTKYVAAIDAVRVVVNGWVLAVTDWLTGLTAGDTN